MPLVQWIMQNLSTHVAQGGAVGGGSALVQLTSFVITTGGAKVDGSALYEKISDLIASGGAVVGGQAYVDDQSANFKKIRHLPGDTVYDKCNKSWVIISFEFSSSGEQTLHLFNNVKRKTLMESEVSEVPRPFSAHETEIGFKLSALRTQPLANLPVYSGRKVLEGPQPFATQEAEISSKLAALRTQPLVNLPVYTGRRKVKV